MTGACPGGSSQPGRRVPGTGALDYLGAWRLLTAGPEASIADVMACRGRVYDRLLRPLLLAALNTEPEPASARLAGAILKETLLQGRRGLPASGGGAGPLRPPSSIRRSPGSRRGAWSCASAIACAGSSLPRDGSSALDFGEDVVALAPGDAVILALPAPVAKALLPEIAAPESFRAILNAHFKIDAPPGWPAHPRASSAARSNGSSPSRTASR